MLLSPRRLFANSFGSCKIPATSKDIAMNLDLQRLQSTEPINKSIPCLFHQRKCGPASQHTPNEVLWQTHRSPKNFLEKCSSAVGTMPVVLLDIPWFASLPTASLSVGVTASRTPTLKQPVAKYITTVTDLSPPILWPIWLSYATIMSISTEGFSFAFTKPLFCDFNSVRLYFSICSYTVHFDPLTSK